MNVPLSLSIALILFSCYGNVGSDNEDETMQSSFTESTTPDYDYNATFEYYYVNSTDPPERSSVIDPNQSCRSITYRSLLISSLLLSLAALLH